MNGDGTPNQTENVRWLTKALHVALSECFSRVEAYDSHLSGWRLQDLCRETFGEQMADPLAAWASSYEGEGLPAEVEDKLARIFAGAFVLVFEPSPLISSFFLRAKIPHLKVRVSHYRFLPDLMLSLEAADEELARPLDLVRVSEAELQAAATDIRDHFRDQPPVLPAGAMIFFAQMSFDATVIDRGRFVSPTDFSARIDRWSGFKTWIVPHPYDPASRGVERWRTLFPDAEVLTENTYRLLATHSQLKCVSLSSSVGFEAQVFGHQTYFLLDHANVRFHRKPNTEAAVANAFWSPKFWTWLISGAGTPPMYAGEHASSLRELVGLRWSRTF